MFYIDEFLKYLKIDKNYSVNTINTYKNNLFNFNNYFNKDIKKIKESDIEAYLKYLHSYMDSRSICNNISSIKSFYKFLNINYNINNISSNLFLPKTTKKIPNVLSEDEINSLLNIKINNNFDIRNKAMIELMYSSGLRVSELINLKINDLNLDNDYVKVFGKGSKERIIPLGDTSIYYLKKYKSIRDSMLKKDINDYLFLNNHGKNMTRQGFFKIIKKIASDNNIEKDFSPHTLRHSFASHMIKYGADIKVVGELLGHSSLSTTSIYINIEDNDKKDKYKKAHPHG